MKFLFADDSRLAGKLFLNALSPLGEYEVQCVSNGKEALECILEDNSFDALFIDWNMPVMQGIDAIRAIRKSNTNLPIIMISGIAEQRHIQEAFESGINAYLQKPVFTAHLKEIIDQLEHQTTLTPTGMTS